MSKKQKNDALTPELEELKNEWLQRLRSLVDTVAAWARELDWSTRTVEKKMKDAEIGAYLAPALLLQSESARIYLEPISRVTLNSQGVVDLYLMPEYDDIASLYFKNGQWNLHYMFNGEPTVGSLHETAGRPLDKEVLEIVLSEMKQNVHS